MGLVFSIPILPLHGTFAFCQTDPAAAWGDLYTNIRDHLISKKEALRQLKMIEPLLKARHQNSMNEEEEPCLVFPLKGYDHRSIGGKRGSGYQPQGYDFFDGNRHRGHPGHDLFIRDKDHDGLDDLTGKPAEVISASPGVVVCVNRNWTASSAVRGGNYLWIYEPLESRYYYYAHLDEILVESGQLVSRGDFLGTVGRTGVNAAPRRSPTHIHFTAHQSVDRYLEPIDLYSALVRGCEKPSLTRPNERREEKLD